jgi:hypothetical protein
VHLVDADEDNREKPPNSIVGCKSAERRNKVQGVASWICICQNHTTLPGRGLQLGGNWGTVGWQ